MGLLAVVPLLAMCHKEKIAPSTPVAVFVNKESDLLAQLGANVLLKGKLRLSEGKDQDVFLDADGLDSVRISISCFNKKNFAALIGSRITVIGKIFKEPPLKPGYQGSRDDKLFYLTNAKLETGVPIYDEAMQRDAEKDPWGE